MICIDTDVFIRDMLDPNDDKALMSRKFMEETSSIVRCTTIFNILEICGVLSAARNLDVKTTFTDFHRDRTLKIIYPNFKEYRESSSFFKNVIDNCLAYMGQQMGYKDSEILWLCEEANCDIFITWNTRHFNEKGKVKVQTPAKYLESHEIRG